MSIKSIRFTPEATAESKGCSMSIKPILFNAEMVRAILAGRKTVTRRVVRFRENRNPEWTGYVADGAVLYGSNNIPAAKSPYRPGDILYVRETWDFLPAANGRRELLVYRADATAETERIRKEYGLKWRPSIHMPREAARIWLRVTNVRVEWLREITLVDAAKEGCENPLRFDEIWDSTIKPADRERYGWAANPWVWVIEFERCEAPEDGGAQHDD